MSDRAAGYDLAPLLGVLAVGAGDRAGAAGLVLASRAAAPRRRVRLRALAWLTLFLSFDLVLLGAFTRLSDSGPRLSRLAGLLRPRQPARRERAHRRRRRRRVPTGAGHARPRPGSR